jgi:hypothetical protein
MCQRQCALCGGALGVLGMLGRLVWWLCRDCGMQFSTSADELPEYDEPDEDEEE